MDRPRAERAYEVASYAQRMYWTAMNNLEKEIGFEVNEPGDLEDSNLDELLKKGEQ